MSDAPERRVLLGRVDELARQREDEARRLQEEVPVLTDVVDGKEPVDELEAGARALADDIEREVLMNLSAQCPEFFARYPRLLEIVSREEEDRKAGRTRYAWYRERGYAIRNHDLAAGAPE